MQQRSQCKQLTSRQPFFNLLILSLAFSLFLSFPLLIHPSIHHPSLHLLFLYYPSDIPPLPPFTPHPPHTRVFIPSLLSIIIIIILLIKLSNSPSSNSPF
ncbi:hypothetical protein BO70DRAFT_168734 [Aspergillus heteromorphus CBS 117.55]|uniref:Uncharacterized protein n=1 Tax=Aspergillus heteromorphus CBS 117.55 TaxID=1448321 RepID=A0A317V5U7_9EURO|nr:uncharacterized protein BO70DRAFT_168734 [Aspergillus heteromorphus CBS 117.55]PWY67550.1 hypothetical protein BO70DRAFT_168734 [Aspergillus heteromorphus CBS 117.55]